MQKLASLGYVGLQKSASAASAVTGVDPKDGIATANKILAARRLLDEGKPEKAIMELQPLMPAAAKMYLAQYAMGEALGSQGKFAEGIEHLRAAIELQPDSGWAHFEMGSLLVKNADYKTAVIHLEIATDRLPDLAAAHSLLAQAYSHLGRAEDAKREQSRADALKK
jgi:predicted Zn-dependent protease